MTTQPVFQEFPVDAALNPRRSEIWVRKFAQADLAAVRVISTSARTRLGRFGAVTISRLGNGWFYPILAVLIFARWGVSGYRMIALAALNAALSHVAYPIIKRTVGRLRPYKVDPGLPCLLATQDEYSFPSGHVMTCVGVLVPVVMLWPAATVAAIVMAGSMAWSKIATAHHYPSDVIGGVLLGAGVSYPISLGVLTLW